MEPLTVRHLYGIQELSGGRSGFLGIPPPLCLSGLWEQLQAVAVDRALPACPKLGSHFWLKGYAPTWVENRHGDRISGQIRDLKTGYAGGLRLEHHQRIHVRLNRRSSMKLVPRCHSCENDV